MKVLVTGATGYVGHGLALDLAEKGYDVNILVREPGSAFTPTHPKIKVFRGDITLKETIGPAIKDCEWVFHSAALAKLWARSTSVFYDINVEGTRNLLDASMQKGIKKFCFTSTCGVIGPSVKEPMNENDPRITGFDNDYNLSKFLAEKLVSEYAKNGLFTVTASLSKVYGPGIETRPVSVNELIRKFILGKITFAPSPGKLLSNYVFMDDLVQGHVFAMEKGRTGEKYILGGENLSYIQFFETLRTVSGKKGKLFYAHKNIAKIYGWLHYTQSRLQGKDPHFTGSDVGHIYCNKSFSSSKAEKELGYIITPFPEALEKTIHFLKNQKHGQ